MNASYRVVGIKKRTLAPTVEPVTVKQKKRVFLPTARMAQGVGMTTRAWLLAAVEAGYLAQCTSKHSQRYSVTDKGRQIGIRHTRGRIGSYYTWPSDIDIIPTSDA